jgi:hypothetical protein
VGNALCFEHQNMEPKIKIDCRTDGTPWQFGTSPPHLLTQRPTPLLLNSLMWPCSVSILLAALLDSVPLNNLPASILLAAMDGPDLLADAASSDYARDSVNSLSAASSPASTDVDPRSHRSAAQRDKF